MLTIDGSYGEGGGQVLRTALSLAAILTQPVRITHIRAGRKQPGLRPQHVQAVKAAAAICNARLEGVKEHNQELCFEPQTPPQSGNYRFDIGTAGAATLVLQTVLLPLALADGPSRITVRGGTHVAWSPPFHYLAEVYLPALAALGFGATARLVRWGFYPKGGGEIQMQVEPGSQSRRHAQNHGGRSVRQSSRSILDRPEAGHAGHRQTGPAWSKPRGQIEAIRVLSAAANVGNQVTARQAKQATNRLLAAGFQPKTRLLNPKSRGPGTCLFILARYRGGVLAGFTGYGRRGYPAERVADDAVDAFLVHHQTGAAADPYLADQLILPLALVERSLSYQTSKITQHLLTNVWVVAQFLGDRFRIEGTEGEPGWVRYAA